MQELSIASSLDLWRNSYDNIHIFPFYKIRPFEDKPEKIRVRCGEWDVKSDQEWYQYQDREIDSITLHPRFAPDPNKLWNDIALVNETLAPKHL